MKKRKKETNEQKITRLLSALSVEDRRLFASLGDFPELLMKDSDDKVRLEVVKQGYKPELFILDENQEVRNEAKKQQKTNAERINQQQIKRKNKRLKVRFTQLGILVFIGIIVITIKTVT